MLYKFRGLVWVVVKARKDRKCWMCDVLIKKGDTAHRPITNGYHRMERICTMHTLPEQP